MTMHPFNSLIDVFKYLLIIASYSDIIYVANLK